LEKFSGFFAKYGGLGIFGIVFLLKTRGIGIRRLGLRVYDIVINLDLRFNLDGLDFMKS
jgi:hypothetical protein